MPYKIRIERFGSTEPLVVEFTCETFNATGEKFKEVFLGWFREFEEMEFKRVQDEKNRATALNTSFTARS